MWVGVGAGVGVGVGVVFSKPESESESESESLKFGRLRSPAYVWTRPPSISMNFGTSVAPSE